jgi:ABC-type nitrate/sulfonate/bicarbonate transport system substrate-binding protein
MPWVAQEAGLFRKYNLDFNLVYIAASPPATAAMLGGDAEVALTGGEGMIRAFVQGATDFVFIGGVKNTMTNSIMAGPEIRKPEDLKGKKIGVTRIGSTPHYFAVQALRRAGLDPLKDVQFIQTGGAPETLATLSSRLVDAATLVSPADAQAIARGFHAVIYGPELKIPFLASALVSMRPVLAKRSAVIGQFMRLTAEAVKIVRTDKEFTFKVVSKNLRLTDRKILEAAYDSEIKVFEPRLSMKPEPFQAILEEIAKVDPRANKVKPEDLMDNRYLNEMEKSGFFEKLWSGK